MFGLTLIRKSTLEQIQAEKTSANIANHNLANENSELRQANKMLRTENLVLFQKVNRPRNEKGQYIKKK